MSLSRDIRKSDPGHIPQHLGHPADIIILRLLKPPVLVVHLNSPASHVQDRRPLSPRTAIHKLPVVPDKALVLDEQLVAAQPRAEQQVPRARLAPERGRGPVADGAAAQEEVVQQAHGQEAARGRGEVDEQVLHVVTAVLVEILGRVALDDLEARDGGPAGKGDAEAAPARAGAEVRTPGSSSPGEPPKRPGHVPVERRKPPRAPALRLGEARGGAEEGLKVARQGGARWGGGCCCIVAAVEPGGPGQPLGPRQDLLGEEPEGPAGCLLWCGPLSVGFPAVFGITGLDARET